MDQSQNDKIKQDLENLQQKLEDVQCQVMALHPTIETFLDKIDTLNFMMDSRDIARTADLDNLKLSQQSLLSEMQECKTNFTTRLNDVKQRIDTREECNVCRTMQPSIDSLTEKLDTLSLIMESSDDARTSDFSSLKNAQQDLSYEVQKCKEKIETLSFMMDSRDDVRAADLSELKTTQEGLALGVQECSQKLTTVSNDIKKGISTEYKKIECKICLVNQVAVCLIPCGHLFCETCSGTLQNNRCHICRKAVRGTQKVFFP